MSFAINEISVSLYFYIKSADIVLVNTLKCVVGQSSVLMAIL